MTVEVITPYGSMNLVGLSTDTKPTIMPVGSTFYETDTGATYMFADSAWGIDLRNGTTLHVRKTATFAGGAGTGAAGTFALFTITGRVYVERVSAFCTTLLSTTGAATVSMGDSNDVDAFIAATTATDIDANEWWGTTVPAAGAYNPLIVHDAATGGFGTRQHDKWLSTNIILTIATADISTGVVIFDVWYSPITDNGRLVAA